VRYTKAKHLNEFEQACSLFSRYTGGTHSPEDYMNDKGVVFLAYYNLCQVLGAASILPLDDNLDDIDSYFLSDIKDATLIESIAVEKTFQKQGFGKFLLSLALEYCEEVSPHVVALCWESPLERQSLILFKDFGFKEVEHFKAPWAGEWCPVCGDNCICDATLVYKDFNAN
jgi:GNAT superfamily N-acetyltransferase